MSRANAAQRFYGVEVKVVGKAVIVAVGGAGVSDGTRVGVAVGGRLVEVGSAVVVAVGGI